MSEMEFDCIADVPEQDKVDAMLTLGLTEDMERPPGLPIVDLDEMEVESAP